MDKHNQLFHQIKDYTVYSISPFFHLELVDGVTSRISFICSQLKMNIQSTFIIMRGHAHKYNFLDRKLPYYLGSPNKFIHLLDLRILFFLKRKFSNSDKNILYVHTIWSFGYALFCKFFLKTPYIFDDHNVEFDRFRSTKRYLLSPFVFLIEFILLRFSKYTVVSSESDKNRLIQLYRISGDNIYVIPVVIKTKKDIRTNHVLTQYGIPLNKIKLLFFASFSYYPNREALVYIQKNILPKLPSEYVFIFCGKNLPMQFSDNGSALYLGYVDDIDSLIYACDCVVAPIFSGGGVKTKILHAMSYGKKIITTTEGVRGIDIVHYENIVIADRNTFLSSILSFMPIGNFEKIS